MQEIQANDRLDDHEAPNIRQDSASNVVTHRKRASSGTYFMVTLGVAFVWYLIMWLGIDASYNALPSALSEDQVVANAGFSGTRAHNDLRNLTSAAAHSYSSREIFRVQRYIEERLEELRAIANESGIPMEILADTNRSTCFFADSNICIEPSNILVRIPGNDRSSVLLSAHYDSRVASTGATDAGSAVVVSLEIIRQIIQARMSGLIMQNTLMVNFNCPEEMGLLGGRIFARHPWWDDVATFVNMEGSGAGGKAMLFQTSQLALTNLYAASAPYPHANVLGNDVFASGIIPSRTDYMVYSKEFGKPGLDLAFYNNRQYYHTYGDNIDNIAAGSLQHLGSNVLAYCKVLLLRPDLVSISTPKSNPWSTPAMEKPVYYDISGHTMTSYPATVARDVMVAFIILPIMYLLFIYMPRTWPGKRIIFHVIGIPDLSEVCKCTETNSEHNHKFISYSGIATWHAFLWKSVLAVGKSLSSLIISLLLTLILVLVASIIVTAAVPMTFYGNHWLALYFPVVSSMLSIVCCLRFFGTCSSVCSNSSKRPSEAMETVQSMISVIFDECMSNAAYVHATLLFWVIFIAVTLFANQNGLNGFYFVSWHCGFAFLGTLFYDLSSMATLGTEINDALKARLTPRSERHAVADEEHGVAHTNSAGPMLNNNAIIKPSLFERSKPVFFEMILAFIMANREWGFVIIAGIFPTILTIQDAHVFLVAMTPLTVERLPPIIVVLIIGLFVFLSFVNQSVIFAAFYRLRTKQQNRIWRISLLLLGGLYLLGILIGAVTFPFSKNRPIHLYYTATKDTITIQSTSFNVMAKLYDDYLADAEGIGTGQRSEDVCSSDPQRPSEGRCDLPVSNAIQSQRRFINNLPFPIAASTEYVGNNFVGNVTIWDSRVCYVDLLNNATDDSWSNLLHITMSMNDYTIFNISTTSKDPLYRELYFRDIDMNNLTFSATMQNITTRNNWSLNFVCFYDEDAHVPEFELLQRAIPEWSIFRPFDDPGRVALQHNISLER